MDGRELDFFRVVLRGLIVLGLDVGEQGELRQEILGGIELKREHGELFQILDPVAVVGKVFLEVIVIAGVNHQPQHLGRAFADGFVFELGDRRDELRPGRRRFCGNGLRAGLEGGGERLAGS